MATDVRLNRLDETVELLSYPLSRADAIDELRDVRLVYADGHEMLADVLARSTAEQFDAADERASEIYSTRPTEAVGEPGQSEGEG